MSVISKALADIKFRIPREILNIVFIKRLQQWRYNPDSIDNQIMNEVIRPRVLVDCNLVGGIEVYIPFVGIPVERTNEYTAVYRFPKDRTQGKTINSVLSVSLTDPTRLAASAVTATCQATPAMLMAQSVLDAVSTIPITSTAYVQLIGENTVMVRDSLIIPANAYLRCILANDEQLSHIQLRSYPAFSKLIEFAVKAFIYNSYIIELDIGELQGGHNLGKIKEVIESYSDAEENYQDWLLNVIQKVSYMNDKESFTRLLKLMIRTQT